MTKLTEANEELQNKVKELNEVIERFELTSAHSHTPIKVENELKDNTPDMTAVKNSMDFTASKSGLTHSRKMVMGSTNSSK